eukprot:6213938-Amphidinium_carterae.1
MIIGQRYVAIVRTSWNQMTCGHVAGASTSVILDVGEDIVCVHCKRDHFLPDQAFEPPLTNVALLYNIAHGVTVAGSSKLKRIEQEQIAMLDQLGRAEPVETEVSSRNTPWAVAVLSSAKALDDASVKESTKVRSASSGKRSAEDVAPPPGLELKESEAKARKTMMIHS